MNRGASESGAWLEEALAAIPQARVAVFGDFCIDAYWLIDPVEDELSVETGLPLRRVRRQQYSLGGAGNVTANLAALGVGKLYAITVIGSDIYGSLMLQMLRELGVDVEGVLSSRADWQTFVFGKPCIGGTEQNRIDFGAFNAIDEASTQALLKHLDRIADAVDIVVLNQQLPEGISTSRTIEGLNAVIARHPDCRFIVDSRDRPELYKGAMVKINAREAARVAGQPCDLGDVIGADRAREYAATLFERFGKTVFVTRGEHGLLVVDETGIEAVPGIHIAERCDPVGAGDTTVAALAAVLGSGGSALTAAQVANMAASVTVRKLQTTGTASSDEIRALGPTPDYVYLPELADDPQRAVYIEGTGIETIRPLTRDLNIRHAVFDHDGTVSTLREGWDRIMELVMVRAILGPRCDDVDEGLHDRAVEDVRRFIDRTTGVQTLSQMQGLVKMVRQYGCVPEDDILDMFGYKAVYNEALLNVVGERVEKFTSGRVAATDFQLENALDLLRALQDRGVTLYLASGTDREDVVAEATALGYADLFGDRIFGAVGDINIEAKREVMEHIIREHGLAGAEFATFGDGPVEIRECHKRGGVAVGVACNEVQRFGLDPAKRARLIRAGADLIVPDFRQLETLLAVLGF